MSKQLKTVISDVDSVLTDGTITYPFQNRSYSLRDGHGVQLLKEAGIRVIFMSGENDESIVTRARKLKVEFCHTDNKLKSAIALKLNLQETAFIGDDVMDVPLLKAVGYAGCPNDAEYAVQEVIAQLGANGKNTYTCQEKGGRHCFREFVNWLLDS
jgi:YrbI family 3-deoxy-D-manno-octulosonate 8-phosphate phosphatase